MDCCGDDFGEYNLIGENGTSACCDNPEDSVVQGICYGSIGEKKKNLTEFRKQLQQKIRQSESEDADISDKKETSTKEQYEDLEPEKGFFRKLIDFIFGIF